MRILWWLSAAALAASFSPLVGACDGDDGGGAETGTGGGCPSGAMPLFTVHIRAKDGRVALSADTTLVVKWTGSPTGEPPFVLGDKSTWHTLDEGVNVECGVDFSAPPPTDLRELVCELWTSSTTEVKVTAKGFVPLEETLTPAEQEGCDKPVPSKHDLDLIPDTGQGGGMN